MKLNSNSAILSLALTGAVSVSASSQSSSFLRGPSASLDSAETDRRHLAITGCHGAADFVVTDFDISFNQHCEYTALRASVNALQSSTCNVTDVDAMIVDLLGATDATDAASKVQGLCSEAYKATPETFEFADITKKGTQFDNEYYSGGTSFNYEVQTDSGEHELKTDAARINRVFKDQAQSKVIDLPTYLPSFDPNQDGCDMNAAFCCWVQDRQANDNNGNCGTPYDSRCIDKDPGDNTNFCYTDHSRSSTATNVQDGFSIFGDIKSGKENIEGAVHCHGFAWAQDDTDTSAVYKGNNLFFVSFYDHMHQRGYVRNAPGSAMCGCAENMAVVTRADCTEIAAAETFQFSYDATGGTGFSGVLSAVRDINFNACQGRNGNNNDLEAYYEQLVDDGKQSQANLDELRKTLVGDTAGQCNAAILDFLSTKGIVREAAAASSMTEEMEMAAMAGIKIVETVDLDLEYERTSQKEESMPDVPTDFNVLTNDKAPAEKPGVEKNIEEDVVAPVVDQFEDAEGGDEEVALLEDGSECEYNAECMSGKCQMNGVCGKARTNNSGNTNKNNKNKRRAAAWWK